MASFPPIQFKRSATPGAKPTDSDILIGEIAINLRDRIIFTKDDSDHIVALGLNPDYDSDLAMIIHDYFAADSDLSVEIYHDFAAADSDLLVDIDSDILKLRHDFLAADSDRFKNIDSDIIEIVHDYLASDSDQSLEALNNVISTDSENGTVNLRTHGKVLGWDSDLSVWKPIESTNVSSVAELTDVQLDSDGVSILQHGDVLVFDSDLQKWIPGESSNVSAIAQLTDVSLVGLKDGMTLSWDSDSDLWKPSLSTTTEPINEQFVATAAQSVFVLSSQPVGDVLFIRNSALINVNAYYDSDTSVVYIPANNNNRIIDAGDRIEIRYSRLTATVPATTLSDITFQDLSGPVDGGGAAG